MRLLPLIVLIACAHARRPPIEPGEFRLVDGTVARLRVHGDGTIEAYLDVRPIAAVGNHVADYRWQKLGRLERDGRIAGPWGFTAEVREGGVIVAQDGGSAESGLRVTDDAMLVSAASGCAPKRAWFTAAGRLASSPAVYAWSTGTGVSVVGAATRAQRRAALLVLALGRWWGTGLSLCDSPDERAFAVTAGSGA